MSKRKPKGYWENIDNVITELKPLISKYGRFPSNNEMAREGLTSLSRYITKYHGGFITVSKKIGVKTYDETVGRKHQNTWTKRLVISEFKKYVKENSLSYYPSRKELKNNGSTLYTGIIQVFKSYKIFKEILASQNFVLKNKQKNTKWSFDKVVEKLKPIVKELGYFPSSSDLNNMNLSGLRGYIDKNKLTKPLKVHFNVKGKPRKYTVAKESGYWKIQQNVINELKDIYNLYGRVPSNKELIELGYGSIHTHINKVPKKILEKYGYYSNSNLIKTKDGHYVRSVYELLFDNFLSFNNISHSYEGVISENEKENYLYDFKLFLNNGIVVFVEVWGYTRNRNKMEKEYNKKRQIKEAFYKKLSLNLIGIDASIFKKSFNQIYLHFEKQVASFDNSFKAKEIDLKYFLYGSNYSENDLIKRLKKIIDKNGGYFPSTNQLRQLENGEGLISQIQKYGGTNYFKRILKTDIDKKNSKWSMEHLKNEIYKINQLKYLPSQKDLEDLNRLDILGGIHKNGGFKKVAKNLCILTKSQYLKKSPKQSKKKWTEEYLMNELKPIIQKYKTIPSQRELYEIGRADLVSGIKKNGGFKKLKKSININISNVIKGIT